MVNIDVLLDCDWMQSAKLGVSRASTKETFAVCDLFSLGHLFFGPVNPPALNGRCGNPDRGFGKFPPGSNPAAGKIA
jgi:hypothetical protein